MQEADEDEGEENSDDVSEEEAERPVKRRKRGHPNQGSRCREEGCENRLGQAGCV